MSQDKRKQRSGDEVKGKQPTGHGQGHPGGILDLLETRDWLQNQLLEYKTQLKSAADDQAPTDDPEMVIERLGKLQSDLLETSSDHKLRDLVLHRIQQHETLMKHLFPDRPEGGGDASSATLEPTQQQKLLNELLSKQSVLMSEILKKHEENQEKRKKIEETQRDNLELKQQIRELMYNLQKTKDTQEQTLLENSQDSNLSRAEDRLKRITDKTTLVRHLFQSLILGSGVDWAQDADLTKLLLELGTPLDQLLS